jgi:drug/metabolite transporter (DMT)-like permease
MLVGMMPTVALGVAAAAGAATCFDGAVILQAQDAREVEQRHGLRLSLLRRLVVRRRWLVGTALAILGVPLQLAAFALAPVAVVQPTLALGMLLLLAVGSRMLDEPVGPRQWAAAAAIVVGIVLLVVSAPAHTDDVPSARSAAIPVALLLAAVAAPFVLGNRRSTAWTLILGAGCAFSLSAIFGKALVGELAAGRPWAALALLAAAGACSGLGFLVDMTALQRFEATRVAPAMFVLETVIPVALAPWLFGESWPGTPAADVGLALGLALVLAGGGVLGTSRAVVGLEHPGAVAGEREDEVGGGGAGAVGQVGAPR